MSIKFKLFKFPVFKTNFFIKHLKFWNKARLFKCVNVVAGGPPCKKQCKLCKKTYGPES